MDASTEISRTAYY